MRFLLDESADARLGPYLQSCGHEVRRIAANYPAGLPDAEVLEIARAEGCILITNDLDFGELVFRERLAHSGVILFRIGEYAPIATKIDCLGHVLAEYADRLDQFLVVELTRVRLREVGP